MRRPFSTARASAAVFLALFGCGQTNGDAVVARAELPPAREARTADAAQAGTPWVPARVASIAPLGPAVAACAPPDGGRPWAETGRADDEGYVYVFLEHADAGASADFSLAVVMLVDGRCEGEIVSGPGAPAFSKMRIPKDDGLWPSLVDKSFAWHVAESGGTERFAAILRRSYGGRLVECEPLQDPATCALPWVADRLRDAGIAVETLR